MAEFSCIDDLEIQLIIPPFLHEFSLCSLGFSEAPLTPTKRKRTTEDERMPPAKKAKSDVEGETCSPTDVN